MCNATVLLYASQLRKFISMIDMETVIAIESFQEILIIIYIYY